MESLKLFWAERAPRERAILLAGGAAVVAVLVFLLLIEPAYKGIGRLERSLPQQRAGAAELEALLSEVKTMRARPQVASVSAGDVRAAVDTSLARAGIKASRIVPLSDGDLQLTFSDVPYASWAPWLAGIERELGARATAVTVTARDKPPGNVDVDLALRLARR
ncbi:MAG: type II secretion system protein M [Pseudomonadota bacterium]|nr:type II secretion system protein M [Pseudomonadota bacterium]